MYKLDDLLSFADWPESPDDMDILSSWIFLARVMMTMAQQMHCKRSRLMWQVEVSSHVDLKLGYQLDEISVFPHRWPETERLIYLLE
jgi:hypothetical protein